MKVFKKQNKTQARTYRCIKRVPRMHAHIKPETPLFLQRMLGKRL